MKRISSHKGSALLIVLGMLAFMVVSAVAFSMFMRQSRLPSSFLVQQIASSHLVKAALAEAMARIDKAIGDGQYPGVGGSSANTWADRVFTEGGGGIVNNTVTTMPLEGLAYLPAPLIDAVRYWSRHTKTAIWESLDYDVGHYAFTAINVSDYLDINRLQSWTMRDSSPSNRVSMAYLFSGDDHDSINIEDAEEFDKFVNSSRPEPQGASARFVSLADFNLAMFSQYGEKGLVGFSNPFFEYLWKKGSDDGTISGGQLGKKVIDQTFITDSWYPTISTNDVVYLTEEKGQPFNRKAMEPGSDINAFAVEQMPGSYNSHFRLNFAEGLALKDYLDEDNSVTLLSYPTIERTPMLTGLQVGQRVDEQANLVLKGYSTPVNEKETVETWKFGGLDKDLQIHYDASAVFPFRRSSALQDSGKYQFQLLVKVFFSSAEDADKFTKVRIQNNFQPTDAEWNNISSTLAYDNNKGYWYACSEKKSLENDSIIKEGAQNENDALLDIKGPHAMEIKFPGKEWSVYAIKYMNEAPESYEPYSDGVVNQDPLQYYTISDKDELKLVNAKQFVDNKRISLCLHYYVWARIIGKDEKIGKDVVVDMFPATAEDSPIIGEKMIDGLCGAVEEPSMKPVVPIVGPSVTMENDDFKPDGKLERKASLTPTQSTAGQLAIYCNDPRFNWAPEDWFSPGSEITKGGWLEITLENRRAKGVNDIFQFVSNQGYLQSMGELQFIPYIDSAIIRGVEKEDGLSFGGAYFTNKQKYNGNPFDKRKAPKDLANDNYMWHTRWLCGQGRDLDDDVDNPYDWGIEDARDGASVSYYAEPHMLLPALANTPYDWIIASTNSNGKTIGNELDEGLEYCFNSDSSEAPLKWQDLICIANCISDEMKASTGNPENAFATCRDWSDKDDFFGVKGLNLSDVDRKFLFSYWRSCFSNKQQLFLIFVRAEPTIMTGMSGGRTPSQLGARAVALVWREPVSSSEASGSSEEGAAAKPHRMRILFYHQFN